MAMNNRRRHCGRATFTCDHLGIHNRSTERERVLKGREEKGLLYVIKRFCSFLLFDQLSRNTHAHTQRCDVYICVDVGSNTEEEEEGTEV